MLFYSLWHYHYHPFSVCTQTVHVYNSSDSSGFHSLNGFDHILHMIIKIVSQSIFVKWKLEKSCLRWLITYSVLKKRAVCIVIFWKKKKNFEKNFKWEKVEILKTPQMDACVKRRVNLQQTVCKGCITNTGEVWDAAGEDVTLYLASSRV